MDVRRIGRKKPKRRSPAFRRQIRRGTQFSQGRAELANHAAPGRERVVRFELRTIDRDHFKIRPLMAVYETTYSIRSANFAVVPR
jgi:hypothetical protein